MNTSTQKRYYEFEEESHQDSRELFKFQNVKLQNPKSFMEDFEISGTQITHLYLQRHLTVCLSVCLSVCLTVCRLSFVVRFPLFIRPGGAGRERH